MQPTPQPTLSTMSLAQLDHTNQGKRKYAGNPSRKNTDPKRFKSLEEIRALQSERATKFISKCASALRPQTRRDQHQLDILGVGGRGKSRFISDQATNPRGRKIFHEPMYAELSKLLVDPSVTMYFLTIVDRDWCLPKGAVSFDRQSMMDRIKRAMRDIGCHGLMFLEIQAVVNMKDIRYMPHVHGVIWYRSGETPMGALAIGTLLEKRFTALGAAKAVTLKKIKNDQPAALWQRFFYGTKLPSKSKSYCTNTKPGLTPTPETRGKLRDSADKNYTDREAARVLRLLAQFQLEETVFAVGEGTKIRKLGSTALNLAAERYGRKFYDRLPPEQVSTLFERVLPKRRLQQ